MSPAQLGAALAWAWCAQARCPASVLSALLARVPGLHQGAFWGLSCGLPWGEWVNEAVPFMVPSSVWWLLSTLAPFSCTFHGQDE